MFLSRYLGVRSNVWKKRFLNEAFNNTLISPLRKYTGITCNIQQVNICQCCKIKEKVALPARNPYFLLEYRRYYAKKLEDLTEAQRYQNEKDLKKITQLFPQPRVTLNELTAKTPQKIFEIHYKQNMVPVRKKLAQGDWTCTYSFVWPEKIKFENTAISKRQAAEKSATQALMWLYFNKRIDKQGCPVYDREVIAELRDTVNQPIQICMSEKSVERIDRIWNEYQSGIKPIYEAAFKEAARKSIITPALSKDSTIDEDEFSEDEIEVEEIGDLAETKSLHPVYGRNVRPPAESTLQRRDRVLKQKFQLYDEEITPLPIDGYADEITSTLQNSRVVVIVGAAGCGKSTRAPAAILKSCGANMAAIVSEPRRVAAIGLAQRVASELGEEVGETVGYQVRLHSKPPRPPGGSILYCTSGVLLRRLQTNPGLEGCTHVIIDEAHERDVNTDITLLLLKRALDVNHKLKIVIMSATLDTEVFIRYFDSCPVIEVPGRTFPVEVSHLDDIQRKYGLTLRNTMENSKKEDSKPFVNCQELVEVIKAVDSKEPEGAILVFLPGWAEIKATKQLLDEKYRNSTTHMILPVHSRLSTTEQSKMFATPSPGIRKIVLSTNIAETSITIPDVVYVIDSGAHKENRIKEGTGTASLETVWVSQAAAKQRAGRAGRVQPGHCYRLYTKDKESDFAQHTTPEILRIPLEQTVLDCKTYAPDDKVENFLSQLPEPPSKKAIEFAVNDLIDLGALTPTEQLTRLGSIISAMTLHPRLACAMLQAATSGSVLAFANIATHCSDNVEVFRDADVAGALTPTEQLTRLGSIISAMTLHPRLACAMLQAATSGSVLAFANIATHCSDNVEVFRDADGAGALTPTEQLTRLGSIISAMTLHPRLACAMLQAATSGSVLAFANIATHCSDNVEVFRDADVAGALTPTEQLTRLGSIISAMTLHPRLACAMLQAATSGSVLAFANIATHCSDNVEVFRDADVAGALTPTEQLTRLGSIISAMTLHPRLACAMLQAATSGSVLAFANIATHCSDNVQVFRDADGAGALTPTEQLTRLGSIISAMTLHPRLACATLQAATSGSVLAFANIATHCSDNVEVFRDAADRREEIRELKSKYSATSDHAALHWIQGEFEKSVQESGWQETDVWCDRHGLRKDRLNYVKSLSNLHIEQLLKSGFIEPNPDIEELTRFSDIEELSAAILLSGADALLTTRRYVKTKGKLTTVTELFTSKGDRAHIGSESVNYGISKRTNKTTLLAFFGGQHSTERRALVVYKTSIIPPHTALLFSKGDLNSEIKNDDNKTTVISLRKHNIKVELPTSHAVQILKAREMWWQTFQYYIDRDLRTLNYDDLVNVSRFKARLVKAIGRILVEGHREYVLGKSKTIEMDEEYR